MTKLIDEAAGRTVALQSCPPRAEFIYGQNTTATTPWTAAYDLDCNCAIVAKDVFHASRLFGSRSDPMSLLISLLLLLFVGRPLQKSIKLRPY